MILPVMKRMGGVGMAVAVLLAVVGVAGCGGDGNDGGSGKAASPSVSVSVSVSASAGPSVSEALDAYMAADAPGCTTADECQALVTQKLAAAEVLRTAMQAKDPAVYAEPIRLVNLADERADHYGRDNLGAKGNTFAVSQPLQQMVGWFGEHPGL
ncbi:hypothetical protein ABZ404_36835 [Streptomyces sp. NPDC005878]|uniref:hypothetical protein n=1 Tax=Streptomyces sp. NPDC005878 TaxID=3157077 RepID=UPI0033E8337F